MTELVKMTDLVNNKKEEIERKTQRRNEESYE